MPVLYDRYCSVTLSGVGKTLDLSALRCRFTIKQSTLETLGTLNLRITNQNKQIAQQITMANSEYTTVTIDAGYKSIHGVIFTGNIVWASYGRENPTDTLTTILAADGDQAHNYGVISQSFAPGSTPQQHFNAAAQAMSKYGVVAGQIGKSIDLSTPVYPRGVALFGMARDVFRDIAKSKGGVWTIQNGQVNILGPDDTLPGSTTVLNSKTGLIGMPTLTIGGIYARSLIIPTIAVNKLVQIDQSLIQNAVPTQTVDGSVDPTWKGPEIPSIAADGVYKIFKLDIEGDTRGNPWYMDFGCLRRGQQTSASIAARARVGNGS